MDVTWLVPWLDPLFWLIVAAWAVYLTLSSAAEWLWERRSAWRRRPRRGPGNQDRAP